MAAQDSLAIAKQAIAEYAQAMETSDRDARLVRFAQAERLFQQLIDPESGSDELSGSQSTALLIGWGNAALQAQHIGNAIVAYRRALEQSPGNTQATHNLQFARSLVPDTFRTRSETQLVDTLFFWRTLLSRRQVALLAASCFFAAAILWAVGYLVRSGLVRSLTFAPLLVWAILGLSWWMPGTSQRSDAVIVVANTVLYSADSENAAPRLSEPLPDGAEVKILQQRERWTEIQVAGRTGWVRSGALYQLPL